MSAASNKSVCGQVPRTPELPPSFLSPDAKPRGPVRPSRASWKRALVLVSVHVAILIHIAHWKLRGSTLSPLEPSEAMYTLRDGVVNAGAIVLALSVLSTLVFGRFFCGWGCHVVAMQDLSAWFLKKIGIHPRPLRSRWLVLVPLLAGVYMFFWPSFMGLVNGIPAPALKDGIMKTDFWETFPGLWLAIATFVVCGGAIVYLLGAKGFCTYACPYGGLFGVVDRIAAGRIRVTDACKQCGHCTAVCTSNVLVNREVLEYGMVVDPGCMKCRDCVSSCPENALYFGFGKPALFARAKRKLAAIPAQFSRAEEVGILATFGLTLLVFRGLPEIQVGKRIHLSWAQPLYDQMPLLFALGLSAITGFAVVLMARVLRRPSIELFGAAMKADGRLTRGGKLFLTLAAAWVLFLLHCAVVQYCVFQGMRLLDRDETTKHVVWWQEPARLPGVVAEGEARWEKGLSHLAVAEAIGIFADLRIPRERSWVALAHGRLDESATHMEESIRRRPGNPTAYRDLAHIRMLAANPGPAIAALREALRLKPRDLLSHRRLVAAFIQAQDFRAAADAQKTVVEIDPSPEARLHLAQLHLRGGDLEAGEAVLRAIVAESAGFAPGHALLGLLLRDTGRAREAQPFLDRAEHLAPGILPSIEGTTSQPTESRGFERR